MFVKMTLVVVGIVALGMIFLALSYNRLVMFRNRMREGWSGVEVQLKRRHELIPQLVEIVSAYRHHERETLESVMEKRSLAISAQSVADAQSAEKTLGVGLGKIVAIAEGYPDLKADSAFRDLMRELVETEDAVQYARRYYNGSVREMNNAVQVFPSNLVAGCFGFKTGDFFEVETAMERNAPEIKIQPPVES